MGKITPRFFLAAIMCGLFLLTTYSSLAINYGPEKPALKEKQQRNSFFVGFYLNAEPTITAPSNRSDNTDPGECYASNVNLGEPTIANANNAPEISVDGKIINPATYEFQVGTTTLTWTITNEDGIDSDTQVITISDNQDPTISAPAAVTVDTDNNQCTASNVNLGTPTTDDNCGIKTTTNNAPAVFPIGETTVTWTVTDNSDNTTIATQTVTVEDNQDPTISAPAAVTVDTDNNQCTASNVNLGTPTTDDNCGIKTTTNNAPAVFPIGETTVTWTVTDNSDNITTATQTVIVEDNQAPVQPTLADLDWSCAEEITEFPTTTDNCDAEITGTTTDPLAYDNYGTNIITWVFTDASGNSVTAEQRIIIPEPTVEIPAVDGEEYCNAALVPEIVFTGNELANKSYEWFYTDVQGNNLDIGLPSSGTGNIPQFTAENNGSESIDAIFSVIPSGGGCQGEPVNFFITVQPTPNITVPDNLIVCTGETVDQIDLSNFSVDGTSISWENDNPSIGLAASGTGSVESFIAENVTNQEIVANLRVVPVANNCEGQEQYIRITVKPDPVVATPEIPELCNGSPTTAPIPLEGNFEGISFDITGGSSIGLSNRTNVREIPVFTPTNNSEVPVNTTITITPKANGCIGEPVEITVKVKPSPIVDASFTNQVCSGEQTDIELSSPVANTGFTWTVDAPAGIEGAIAGSLNSEGVIEQELTNNTSQPQTVTYRITPEAAECAGTTIPINIVVNPTPNFEINLPECVSAVDLTDPSIKDNGNLNYTYWENAEATIEISNPSEVSLGTYYIKGESNAGCALIKEILVDKIKPEIANLDEAPTEICSNTVFNFTPESSISDTSLSWTRAEIAGISNPSDSSTEENKNNPSEILYNTTNSIIEVTYIFYLTNSNGCSTEKEVKVDILPAPALENNPYTDELCNGDKFEYTPQSTIPGTSFSWERRDLNGNVHSSGSGPINETLYNESENRITYTYHFTLATNSCTNPQEFIIPVTIKSSSFQVEASSSEIEICPGESIDLFSNSELDEELDETILYSDFSTLNGWSRDNAGEANWQIIDNRYVQSNRINLNPGSNVYNNSLYSPTFSTIGYQSAMINLSHYYDDVSAGWGDAAYIFYSIDNGENWTSFKVYESDQRNGNSFINDEISLPDAALGQENVSIKFNFYNGGTNRRGYIWALNSIEITGEIQSFPDIEWTSSADENWISNEQNPTDIIPSQTTTYTVKYKDSDLECPGIATVKVTVKDPLQPRIVADYCAFEESNRIRLSADQEYDSYRWESAGETISNNSSLEVSLAQTYTLYVTRNGCEASTSLTPSENLVTNGDFEDGNTGFNTVYRYVPPGGNLYPEGDYAVDDNARDYHNDFYGFGHGGSGNFMIVNGDPSQGNVVWQTDPITISSETDYYFSAWTSNLVAREEARLRLVITLPGQNTPLAESNLGDLTGLPRGEWIQFYNPQVWNSGPNTEVVLKIVNENPVRDGNDFGIDDISFSAFRSFDFEFTPENNGPVCEGETIELAANLDGARLPITFDWTGPNGFSRSKTITEENERAAADTIQIPNATADMAGEYSLQISDFYGCNLESKTTSVEVIEKAVVFAGEDVEVCSNDPVIDLSSASVTHATISSGTWSTSDGDNSRFADPNLINTTYNPNQEEIDSGEIELVLTSDEDSGAVCETISDTINIVFNISPEFELIPRDVSCFEGDNGKIEISITEGTGTGPFTYQWSNGQTGRVAENLIAGDYYVEVTDAKSCSVTSETISIGQPDELLVGNPIQIQEASCFDEFGTVVGIPVSGGLFKDETIEPENIPYVLEILDTQGNQINLAQDLVNYDIATGRFIISGLQGGKAYTFLVSSSENCSAEVKTFTTLSPPEINAGEAPEISECGIKTLWLSASPVDPTIGTGSWSYNNGETTLLGDPNNPNTSFTGQPGQTYTLTWSVISVSNPACNVSDDIEITFPASCSQLNFDGVDDFVDLGDHYNINSSFSIEAWVKPNSTSQTKTILSKRTGNNLNSGYDLFLNNGAPTFRVNNTSVVARNKINTDRWYHIAAVYNQGSALKIYVDGIEIQTNTTNIPQSVGATDTPALIGAAYAPDEPIESKDHFEGFIEEVRLWNTAIPTGQIRFFMNQRLKKDGSDVSGTVLGNNLNLPNAPETIAWNNLLGYYQLLAQTDLISDGYTDNLGNTGESANGLLKNIQEMQENTAPLPYILYTNGKEWFDKTTWTLPAQLDGKNISQRDVWNPPGSQGVDNSGISWNIVKISEDIENPATQNNQNNINLLGLISEKGILNMKGVNNMGGSQTGFGTGTSLTITHYLQLDGIIDLNGESQLIQTEGSEISGSGWIERDQQGTASSFNYNYWGSPVLPNANSSTYKVNQVMHDGTYSENKTDAFQNIDFKWPHTHADGPSASPNPIKISDYWINAFRARKANEYSQWEQIGSYTALKPGEGYTMKGTSKDAKIIDLQNYTFNGFPNNGTIALSEIKPGQNYLLGNPYPSAISIEEFILDNIKDNGGRNDKNLLNGAVYFWDHFGGRTHHLAQYVGGYAVRNLLAGVSAISNDSRINANGASSTKRAGPYIPVGQGFFVNTTQDPQSEDIDDFGSGNIVFKNSQRAFVMERGQSFSFFMETQDNLKTAKVKEEKQEDNRYKIRLRFHSPTGYHREILVGADSRTSMGFDLGFDAPLIDRGAEDMYWLIGDRRYVIQGVPHFNLNQRLPLGVTIAEEKEFSIEIEELHNIPDITEIYLRDNSVSTYYDLRKVTFKATLPPGEYKDLYEIVFQDPTSVREDKIPSEGSIDYFYSIDNREFVISNPELHKIEHINIYNITGQLVDQHFGIPDIKEIHIPQKKSLSSAVYIVKVYTSNGNYAKKVIIRKD